MKQPGKKLTGTAKWVLLGSLALGAFGCELITNVDRSLIDGTSSTASGTGGSGGGASECAVANDCPDPGNECITRTCEAGKCGTTMVADGTAVVAQTKGDCKVMQCDGAGATVAANDDLDVPTDTNPCTDDACTAGVPSNNSAAAGTSCGASLVCDGAGKCVGCVDASECPGQTDDCQTVTCTAGTCGTSFTAAGTKTTTQTAGDCQSKQCDGAGAFVTMPDNTDLPVDGNECTGDICTGGVPSNPATMAGGVCTTMGGTVCDGTGKCVECNVASTCPGVDSDCQQRTCIAGACGMSFVAAGTAAATQLPGDCKSNKCNGTGAIMVANDDTDVPVDNNPCTGDVCTAGVPSHPAAAAGTSCGVAQVCDAAGACTGCLTALTCPGTDNECQTRTCTASVCGFNFAASGTAANAQTAGDCKKNQCDGAGAIVPATDDTDVPVDGNACSNDVCTAGVPSHTPTASGSACAQMGGTLCNGNSVCVECLVASTCGGVDADCKARTCTAGVCGFANTPVGTVTTAQSAGDCKENQCDGNGSSAPVAKNTDLPADDGNQCTGEICTAGVPSHPPTASGTACNQMSGAFCDGASVCVECVANANCASGVCTNNACAAPSCTDAVKNGAETGVDCGGGICPSCGLNSACAVASDCASGVCTNNVCSQINGCDLTNAVNLTGGAPTAIAFGGALGLNYVPKCIKVTQGTVVTFNGDFSGHPLVGGEVAGGSKVQASTGPFLPATSTGMAASFTMSATGAFPYYCDFHALSGMTGAVFVVP
jgi:plastocyanin